MQPSTPANKREPFVSFTSACTYKNGSKLEVNDFGEFSSQEMQNPVLRLNTIVSRVGKRSVTGLAP